MFLKFVKYSIKEYLFSYFSVLFLILYWNSAHTLPKDALRYPFIISVVVTILIIANLVDSVRKFRREIAAEQQESAAGRGSKERWDCTMGLSKKRVGVFIATLLYPALLPVVGFIPLSLVYLFGVSFFLGIRNYKIMVLYSIAVTLGLFGIFQIWLDISLPQGFLGGLF